MGGSLTTSGPKPLPGLRVRLDIGARLDNRSSLQDAGRQPPAYQRSTAADPVSTTLAAGGAASFTYTVPVDQLGLGRLGVYPLRVDVRDQTGTMVGHLDTFLPWFPDGVQAGSATRLAWVWPLTARPHRDVGRTLIDDELLRDLVAGGRLDALLNAAAAAAAPVTYAVDADLIETVATMTTPYDVVEPTGQHRPGVGTPAATSFLTRLRAAVQAQQVVALPYADPDVNALARARLEAEVATALTFARDALPRLLAGAQVSQDIAWPPDGMATPAGLDAYVNSAVTTVVLDDGALPAVSPPCCSTPNGHATMSVAGRVLDVALLDSGLAGVLAGSAAVAGGPRVAEQRFLAETALITAERSDTRAIVAAPPRRWAPDPTYAASVLADTATVPWLRPAALADVLAAPHPPAGRSLSYPASAVAAELSPAYLGRIASARAELRSLRSSLPNDELTTPVRSGLLRSVSASWRDDLRTGAALQDRVVAAQEALVNKVRVTSTGQVTLTSSHGAIPVTIANDLDQPISVIVRLDARNAARLQARTGDVQAVAAHSSKQISVRADALTSGEFIVNVTLLTLDGGILGERSQLLVRSTGYGRVALGITGGAAGLLLAVAGMRGGRRALRSRRRREAPREPARQDVSV